MRWELLHKTSFIEFITFVIRNEWKSVTLSSRLVTQGNAIKAASAIHETVYCLKNEETGKVSGVLMLAENGLLLPLFENATLTIESSNFEEIQNKFRKRGKIFCILGFAPNVEQTRMALELPIDTEREYYLLESPLSVGLDNPENTNIHIRKAGISDADKLYHLEEKYIQDEVLIHKELFHPRGTLRSLKHTCDSQILLYAETGGIPIAKANTNAIGINYAQVGGVFTDYTWRRKGISTLLMQNLIHEITQKRKKSILFVKKTNTPAYMLYQKLGFKKRGDYRIIYIKY